MEKHLKRISWYSFITMVIVLVVCLIFINSNSRENNFGGGYREAIKLSSASTSPIFLTGTASTTSLKFDTQGVSQITTDIQVIASSSTSKLNWYWEFSEDGVDWFRDYPLDLTGSSTPISIVVGSTTPYFTWAPGTTETMRRKFAPIKTDAKIARITFYLGTVAQHLSVWAQINLK